MKKLNRTSVSTKLVLHRESIVVLGVTQLGQVAGASQLQGCGSFTKQTSFDTGTGD